MALLEFYQSIDLDAVHRFVEQRRQEDVKLDFKTLGNNATFEREDRRNLAIAISGFANAEGGIIVWGVRADKDDEGLDAANALAPIENCERALSELRSYASQASSPSVVGVDCKLMHEPNASKGYLVLYVPASEGDPCMAKLGEDRYYKRTGDRFIKMEQYEIADMFGKRRRPLLSLHVDVVPQSSSSGPHGIIHDLLAVVGIRNTGRGLARYPYLAFSSTPYTVSHFGLDGNRRTGLPRSPTRPVGRPMDVFAGGSDDVVHSNSILEVTNINVRVTPNRVVDDLTIIYRLGAEDVPVADGSYVVRRETIAGAIST